MAGDEVDAVDGLLAAALIEIGAAAKTRGKRSRHPEIATPETADVIPELAVPFSPALPRKAADLVGASQIPGFDDQFDVAQNRILSNSFEKRCVLHELSVLIASQYGGQIEPEAVDVHLRDPVPQAVDDVVAHDWVIAVQRVSTSRKIQVLPQSFVMHIPDRVVEPAEAERRTILSPSAV